MPRTPKASAAATTRTRKNMDMDADKLRAARKVLGARTETETVDMALDYVLFQDEVFSALDRLAALGGLDDVYGTDDRPSRRHVAER